MKQNTTLLLLTLICSCKGYEQRISSDKTNKSLQVYVQNSSPGIRIKNDVLSLGGNRFSGCIYELDSLNEDTLSIAEYSNGLLDGKSKKWYPGKRLMEERFYSKGKKNGKQISYWQNGNKRFEFVAKDDAYEGELKEWNVEGKLIHLATFKNGQEEGPQKLWYDNGKIRANYVMLQGKRYGLLGTKNCRNVSDSIFLTQ
jgi:antitoxin component YwqK of YwqJK toxin-antitoxin module